MNVTFPKSEKLCSNSAIDMLYQSGKKFVAWPLRVTYLPISDAPTQVLIWAPKSLFKHAIDRNHMRRLMREAYRLNKHILSSSNQHYHLAFNYIDKEKQDFHTINKAISKALKKLTKGDEK